MGQVEEESVPKCEKLTLDTPLIINQPQGLNAHTPVKVDKLL